MGSRYLAHGSGGSEVVEHVAVVRPAVVPNRNGPSGAYGASAHVATPDSGGMASTNLALRSREISTGFGGKLQDPATGEALAIFAVAGSRQGLILASAFVALGVLIGAWYGSRETLRRLQVEVKKRADEIEAAKAQAIEIAAQERAKGTSR